MIFGEEEKAKGRSLISRGPSSTQERGEPLKKILEGKEVCGEFGRWPYNGDKPLINLPYL